MLDTLCDSLGNIKLPITDSRNLSSILCSLFLLSLPAGNIISVLLNNKSIRIEWCFLILRSYNDVLMLHIFNSLHMLRECQWFFLYFFSLDAKRMGKKLKRKHNNFFKKWEKFIKTDLLDMCCFFLNLVDLTVVKKK